jgi:ACS family hexuronate transporter-like MFS transporter
MAIPSASSVPAGARASVGSFRWVICTLLFLAATVNYIDRQVISLLKPTLQQQFGWSEIDYANIVFAFQLAYAIGLLIAGRVIDRIGTKAGFSIAILIWSVAAMAHAFAPEIGHAFAPIFGAAGLVYSASVVGFIVVRFALGLGEAGNFPASIKTVAEWFPKKERALATGIFNSGTNIGAVVAPLVVPWMTSPTAGRRHSASRACSDSSGSCCGGRSTRRPARIAPSARRRSPTFGAIRPIASCGSRG